MESGVSALSPSHTGELYFLRSRVRELEREKAELSAENQRLKTMLVHGESRSSLLSQAPFSSKLCHLRKGKAEVKVTLKSH